MRRYHSERELIKRRHREHLRELHGWPKLSVNCVCDLQAGRFRKQKVRGCGRSRCLLCHYEKVFKIPSKQGRVRQQAFNDSLADFMG
jgi:hypothetical protein